MELSEDRKNRFKSVIAKRQYDLTVVLENVHDPHNIGAILRTCDSVGITEIFVIYTDPRLQERGLEIGYKSSSGTKQWIDVHYFENIADCLNVVKEKYKHIYGTCITTESQNLYHLDFSQSAALLFGNEHSGISKEASEFIDTNFLIPQYGFVRSLNISVACAVSLYEVQRQRKAAGKYDQSFGSRNNDLLLYQKYEQIHWDKKLLREE